MKRKILGLSLGLMFCLVAGSAYAADFLVKEKNDKNANVVVAGDTEYRNLYTAGATVSINKNILGDLFAAGGSINVTKDIEDDLVIAGGNLNVSAPVGGDARIAGGNINISSDIGGDLITAGGTVSIADIAIGGDLWTASGVLNFSGDVAGDARLAGGQIFIDGTIDGDVEIWADESLVFGNHSVVLGKIIYHGVSEATIEEGAQVSEIDFQKTEARNTGNKMAGFFTFFLIVKIIALFLGAWVVSRLLKKSLGVALSNSFNNTWRSLGWGLLGMIAIPIIAIILIVGMITSPLGILLLTWFVFSMIMSALLSVIYLGKLVRKLIFKREDTGMTIRDIAWGLLAGFILSFVPLIGGLAICAAFLISYGGILEMLRGKLQKERE